MALQQTKTFKDIQDAVISEGKLADNTEVRDEVKRKINDAYSELGFEENYVWNGITRSFLLKGKYSTGTVTMTKGSNTVTGDSTVWTDLAHRRWKLYIAGQSTPYKVVRVASNTSLTLDQNYLGTTTAGLSYVLFKDEYGFFPDAENIRWLYLPGFSTHGRMLPSGPEEFERKRQSQPFAGGRPRLFTVQGQNLYNAETWASFRWGIDFWEELVSIEDSQLKQKNMMIWPANFSDDLIAQVRYTFRLAPMGADDDEPLVPISYRNVLVYRSLKRNFIKQRDSSTSRAVAAELKILEKRLKADVEATSDNLTFSIDRRDHGRRSNRYATNNFSRS